MPLPPAGEPVSLYVGPVELRQGAQVFNTRGVVQLRWLPRPAVRFELDSADLWLVGLDRLQGTTLTLESGETFPCAVLSTSHGSGEGGPWGRASGALGLSPHPSPGEALGEMRFFVANLDAPCEEPIRYPAADGRPGSDTLGRLVLRGSGWEVTLDQVAGHREVVRQLQSESGFAVTHIGRLKRQDGGLFDYEVSQRVLSGLANYLSLASGQWVGPCLPAGYDDRGGEVWRRWMCHRTSPYRGRATWVDGVCPASITDPFPGFLRLWLNEDWREDLALAIHWHIEANGQAASIEGSITLIQTALELLASLTLASTNPGIDARGYASANRIRDLLNHVGLPTDLAHPLFDGLDDLRQCASREGWRDAPHALTEVRNTITHPSQARRASFRQHTLDVRVDVWNLGMWYLDLCLLALFDYHGQYGNRLRFRYTGQVDPVPYPNRGPLV